MKPSCFNELGKSLLSVKCDSKYSLTYEQPNSCVSVSTDNKLGNPCLCSKFTLEPGTIEIKSEAGKLVSYQIMPNIPNAKVKIMPTTGGSFTFETSIDAEKVPIKATLGFNSDNKEVTTTIEPNFTFKSLKLTGDLVLKMKNFFEYHAFLDHQCFALRASCNSNEKTQRLGLFLKHQIADCGARFAFTKEGVKEIEVMALGKFPVGKVAGIVDIKPVMTYQLRTELCKAIGAHNLACAMAITYQKKEESKELPICYSCGIKFNHSCGAKCGAAFDGKKLVTEFSKELIPGTCLRLSAQLEKPTNGIKDIIKGYGIEMTIKQ